MRKTFEDQVLGLARQPPGWGMRSRSRGRRQATVIREGGRFCPPPERDRADRPRPGQWAVLPPKNVGKARDVVAARPREPARYRNPPAPAVGRLSNGHYTLVSTSWSCLPNSRSSGHFAMTAAMSTPLMSWARPWPGTRRLRCC